MALDLFCGAGGVSMGLHQAGFDVVGIDIKPQPNYPFPFVQADALVPPVDLTRFDMIWASPPCQAYSMIAKNTASHPNAPDLVGRTRELLRRSRKPYVIENVAGAPLEFPFMLCGASFGLGVGGLDLNRHRYFESSEVILAPPCQHQPGKTIGVYGNGTNSWHREKHGRNFNVAEFREAMGINWMTRAELSQAIPPAYSKFIGEQLRGK